MNGGWGISYEIALRWMPLDLTDKSTLVQVTAWCRQATCHYLSQCWPWSISPYGITRPLWVSSYWNAVTAMVCAIWIVDLNHQGRVMHICVGKSTNIGSNNGMLPGRRQAIIWTNAGILLIGPLETNFSEILIKIFTFSFKKMYLKMSSGWWQKFCLVSIC